jgi:hypothetical protein
MLWEYDYASAAWEMTNLDTLGGVESNAWSVNNAGQVAGTWYPTPGEPRVFVWTEQEGMADRGPGQAYDINHACQVAGQSGGQPVIFECECEGTCNPPIVIPLPTRSGGVAYALNDAGHVVGGDSDGEYAFLWLPEPAYGLPAGTTNLNDLVPANSCWVLKAAWDINDAGQIVGFGESDGQPHAFVMDLAGEADCDGNGVLDACDIAGGTGADCQVNGVLDECDIAIGASDDCNTNGIPDECEPGACCLPGGGCAVILESDCRDVGGGHAGPCANCASTPCVVAGRSCQTHGTTEQCLELGVGGARAHGDNIEPRFPGVHTLDVEFDGPVDWGTLTIDVWCVDSNLDAAPYTGTTAVTPTGGNTGRIEFTDVAVGGSPEPLPDQTCCTIVFGGSGFGVRKIRSLAGDVGRDGEVTVSDKALIKPKIGEPLDSDNFYLDVNCDGEIKVSDMALVKPKIGNTAPECP